MAKLRLDDKVDPHVTVLGISSHVPDYRLCWSLNKALQLELERRREDIVEKNEGRSAHYAVFLQSNEDGDTPWSLVCNTCGRKRLIPQEKQADYFLVVDREIAPSSQELVDRVRGAEFVLTAFPVELDRLRSGHKLLL